MADGNDAGERNAVAKELLLADYAQIADALWKNEQTGETRVNWFLTLVAAVAGGLVGLSTAEHGPKGNSLRLIVISFLFSLLMVGLVTMLRLFKRNETTDGLKKDMQDIRQRIKDHFDLGQTLFKHYPFMPDPEVRSATGRKKADRKGGKGGLQTIGGRKLGGLVHIVAALNSLLAAGIVGAMIYPFPSLENGTNWMEAIQINCVYAVGLATFAVTFWVQHRFARGQDAEVKKRLSRGGASHAGGIVFRTDRGKAEYLLVGPQGRKRKEWFFCKGHIERECGEGHGEAAARETCEESGVVARPICLVGLAEFEKQSTKERVWVKYYLMERVYENAEHEDREVGWFGFEAAVRELGHDQNRALLREAERVRVRLEGAGEGTRMGAD